MEAIDALLRGERPPRGQSNVKHHVEGACMASATRSRQWAGASARIRPARPLLTRGSRRRGYYGAAPHAPARGPPRGRQAGRGGPVQGPEHAARPRVEDFSAGRRRPRAGVHGSGGQGPLRRRRRHRCGRDADVSGRRGLSRARQARRADPSAARFRPPPQRDRGARQRRPRPVFGHCRQRRRRRRRAAGQGPARARGR